MAAKGLLPAAMVELQLSDGTQHGRRCARRSGVARHGPSREAFWAGLNVEREAYKFSISFCNNNNVCIYIYMFVCIYVCIIDR